MSQTDIDLRYESRLERLLDLRQADDIYDVIGRMKIISEIFARDPKFNGILPFLLTYLYVTESVCIHAVEDRGYFEDPSSIERLDIYFANRFFEPLELYVKRNVSALPWQEFFNYSCSDQPRIAFLKMLLGINAHINGDLAVSLYKTNYSSKKDFDIVNEILEETIPKVFNTLVLNNRDIISASYYIAPGFFTDELKRIIVPWRENAWNNYQILKSHEDPESVIERIHQQTEDIAKSLVDAFKPMSMAKPLSMISGLENLKVSL